MSAFKELVASDIENVFLNIDEFGEEKIIDGKEVVCVADDAILKQLGNVAQATITAADLVIYAKSMDLPPAKGYGSELMVDGVPYTVISWGEEMGMAVIALSLAYSV